MLPSKKYWGYSISFRDDFELMILFYDDTLKKIACSFPLRFIFSR